MWFLFPKCIQEVPNIKHLLGPKDNIEHEVMDL